MIFFYTQVAIPLQRVQEQLVVIQNGLMEHSKNDDAIQKDLDNMKTTENIQNTNITTLCEKTGIYCIKPNGLSQLTQ